MITLEIEGVVALDDVVRITIPLPDNKVLVTHLPKAMFTVVDFTSFNNKVGRMSVYDKLTTLNTAIVRMLAILELEK